MQNCHITNNNGELRIIICIEKTKSSDYATPNEIENLDDQHICYKYFGSNAIDFIMNLYGENIPYAVQRNMNMYTNFLPFKYKLVDLMGIPPHKSRPSDSGFDLNLVSVKKQMGKVTLYGTGVSVQPPSGYYFDLVPRSSMIKSGYMMANSVGIIDQGYTGEILVPLIKMDPDATELVLPCRMVQIIPRKWYGFTPVEDDEHVSSNRGSNGFGSTGK